MYFKIYVILSFIFFSVSSFSQNCDTDAIAIDDDTPFCCHELSLINNEANAFVDVRLTPLDDFEFANVVPNSGWQLSVNDPAEIRFIFASGFIPTGSSIPLSYCIEKQGAAPQRMLVEWIDVNNQAVCTDTISMDCQRCLELSNEEFNCNSSSGYRYQFDFTNISTFDIFKLEVEFTSPVPNSITPASIDFSASPISPGNSSTGHVFDFDLPVTTGIFEFTIKALGEADCCQCISDTIRIELPNCCGDLCEEVGVNLKPEIPLDNFYCCWSLDLENVCDSTYFSGIKLEIPSNLYFSSISVGSGWQIDQPTPTMAIWRPRFFTNNGNIPAGDTDDKIIFCLDGITSPLDLPQQIMVSWLGDNDVVECDTIVETECEIRTPGSCIIVEEDTVTCLENGDYQLDLSIRNIGNFTATTVIISNVHSIPSGGNVIFSPTTLGGLNFQPGDVLSLPSGMITGLNPGDQVCLQLSLSDSLNTNGATNCCHTDLLCFTMPECPSEDPCGNPCENKSFTISPSNPNMDFCCHSLEIEVECDSLFSGVRLEALNGVIFSSMTVPFNYGITNTSASDKIVKPRFFAPDAPFITSNQPIQSIDFCLGRIQNPSQVPQEIVLHWLNLNGESICTDTLTFDCEPLAPGDCIVVLNDTIKCDPPGHYALCFDVVNVGQFTGKYIKVENFHTNPVGGIFSPASIDSIVNFAVGDTISIGPIHVNGSAPGESLCYTISIFDDPNPTSGYNNCCHTDTLCKVLPDCGDEMVCDSVSYDTLTTAGDCCFTLEIDNRWSATHFEALKLTALNPGVIVSTASTYPDWSVSPCPGGYQINYNGPGAPFIPLGVSVPIDFCVSGHTTNSQTLELTWMKTNGAGELITECCQGLVLNCPVPVEDFPCFDIANISSTCEDDQVKLHFKLMNNTNLNGSGFPINQISFSIVSPLGAQFNPNPIVLSTPLNPGQMQNFTVNVNGVQQGQTIHFNAGVHFVNPDQTLCCLEEQLFCFTAAECDTIGTDYCDTLQIVELVYDGWIAVTCGPTANPTPVSSNVMTDPVLGIIDIKNHANAPRNMDWGASSVAPSKIMGIGTNNWDYQTLGKIFGLAFDPMRNVIYTSATALYEINLIHWGIAGQPAIYQVDLNTGAVTPLLVTVNTCLSESPGPFTQIPNYVDPATNDAAAFGNLALNYQADVLYVSNLEDGVIYIIDPLTGNVLGGFDPWTLDSGNCGQEFRHELIRGLQFHRQHGKLYFHKESNETSAVTDPTLFQEIWSVKVLSNGMIDGSSLQLELQIPDIPLISGFSFGITDISFSSDGNKMLLAERGEKVGGAHQARLLEYKFIGGSWIAEPSTKFRIGNISSSMDNSAGGSDYLYYDYQNQEETCDSLVLGTGNALQFNPNFIYGLQGLPASGGDVTNSFLYDFDGALWNGAAKYDIGDVEAFRNMCCGQGNTTSVIDPINPDDVRIYPNPTTDWIQIESNLATPISSIQIFDMSGKRIYQISDLDLRKPIELKGLTAGIYVVQILLDNQALVSKKLVLMKR